MTHHVRRRNVPTENRCANSVSKARAPRMGRSNKTIEERLEFLKTHKYVRAFGEYWAQCAACGQNIKLDNRNEAKYFPNSLNKHLNTRKCKSKQRVLQQQETKEKLEIAQFMVQLRDWLH
ncbi:hypothetical protein HYPSUDRAFT_88611 [Hypholoma sublateritium FD-334 SS-4]|uniref:Uncharacterized protein n=1 Tax=Hypholoma sublateritium (strain FD-334 SS-4) TaxID=945553 RepID=A0A0D2PL88_HYPSF|nr:hypothetical protein HYPSUDRAFT_88611 [Hypholoma sublateritium FD-334 SS-4]